MGKDFSEQMGEIIPWAASHRNDGRIHLEIVGAFSPESAPAGAQSTNRCQHLLSARLGPDGALPFDLARSHALYKTLLSPSRI